MSFIVADAMKPPRDVSPAVAHEMTISSETAHARQISDGVEQLLKGRQIGEHDVFSIKLALEEALINAIKHGNQMDRTKQVHIAYQIFSDRFHVQITDDGPGFDPSDVPDPTAFENLERPCGRGLMLMRHYMTEVAFNATGNAVTMTKFFRSTPAPNGKK